MERDGRLGVWGKSGEKGILQAERTSGLGSWEAGRTGAPVVLHRYSVVSLLLPHPSLTPETPEEFSLLGPLGTIYGAGGPPE